MIIYNIKSIDNVAAETRLVRNVPDALESGWPAQPRSQMHTHALRRICGHLTAIHDAQPDSVMAEEIKYVAVVERKMKR